MLDTYVDELIVGSRIEGTRGRTITEADLMLFSAVSGDWSPLHNDAEFARTGPFGTRIAHGLLVVSLMTGLAPINADVVAALYGFDRIRFVRPVRLGDTIHYRATVAHIEPRADLRGLVDLAFDIVNQAGDVCVAGTIKLLANPRSLVASSDKAV
jgi:3-hydroxybutyryl-CoA dehydratase